ncbi:MAG TPA: CARDB domain-containing protein [Thermoplasmata archaeon]|nr:CARDB domain-containing protein [Thermoplasmata archaeon]
MALEPRPTEFAASGHPTSHGAAVFVRLTFPGSHSVEPVGLGLMSQRNHYFLGSEPSHWHTDVRSYAEVAYEDLYEGIDLVYRFKDGRLKYEFLVRPGADPGTIQVAYEGIDSLQIDDGDLVVRTAVGELRDTALVASQGGIQVPCGFSLRGLASSGFACWGWDPAEPLLIDPLIYSTFLGGDGLEETSAMAVDASGSAYVVGSTPSMDFPTSPGAFDTSVSQGDVFVTKLDPTGAFLVFSTYLGGTGSERAGSVAIDPFGGVYLAGTTNSVDFPTTPGTPDRVFNGTSDGFVAKFGSSGSVLEYATFLGGDGDDLANALALDVWGNAYITGVANATNFPTTPDALDRTLNGSYDAYLAQLNPSGTSLLYSTVLGGGGNETGFAIALGSTGTVYVAGATSSGDFPTTPLAFDRSFNGALDAFVTSFTPLLTALGFSTYLGGGGVEPLGSGGGSAGLAVDGSGAAYFVGSTDSANFPTTPGAFDVVHNGNIDLSLTKFNGNGTVLYSTLLGGSGWDTGDSLGVDASGAAYVTGSTTSANFPATPEAYDASLDGPEDAFVAKFSPQGDSLRYATYVGGLGFDRAWSIAADPSGDIYLAGNTGSSDFPTTSGAFDQTFNGGFADAFVAKLRPEFADLEVNPSDISFGPPGPVVVGTSVTIQAVVHNVGERNASNVAVRFHDGPPSPSTQIGGDQVLPSLPLGGSDTASVSWSAGPVGLHSICAVADPDEAIREVSEANNQACATISVEPPPGPDLVVVPSEMAASPPPPYEPGQLLWIDALVRNGGTNASGATIARFYEGVPPAPQIGGDQALAALAPGGVASVLVSWTPTAPGSYRACVVADPDDAVPETNETNNMACIDLVVSETRPDYAPTSPDPASPAVVGLSRVVFLSVVVRNLGNATPGSSVFIAFFNASTPASPFRTDSIPPVAPSNDSARFTATWIAPSIPGAYRVVTVVDYGDSVLEWNESNNEFAWTIQVVPGPITTLAIGQPNYTAQTVYVTSATMLSLEILDRSGTGIRSTRLGIDGAWIDYAGPFTLATQAFHLIEWYSEDFAENREAIANSTLFVDDTPPVTLPSHGDGTYPPETRISFAASDGGSGIARTEFSVDGQPWTPFSAPVALGLGAHVIRFRSVDNLNNTEPEGALTVTISSEPPPPPPAVEPNWKPIVAAAFATVLAFAGAWSSWRNPWTTGARRRLHAFVVTALPFVLLEGATGVVSFFTGWLAIPPLLGLGTAVDVGILFAGLAALGYRGRARTSRDGDRPRNA